jgi:hypothetical protein
VSTTELFQIAEAEVVAELNPLSVDGLLELDGTEGVPSSIVASHANRAEAVVASGVPEIYRELLREVRGEIVVQEATAGQVTLQLGLYPVVEGSLVLYVDFGKGSRASSVNSAGDLAGVTLLNGASPNNGQAGYTAYRYRTINDRLATTQYSLAKTTGVVTLINDFKLGLGQTVHADYKHTALTRCYNLRDIAVKMAAASLGKSLPDIASQAWDNLERMESRADAMLSSIMEGRAGVDLLDNLKLADETRTDQHQTGKQPSLLFW